MVSCRVCTEVFVHYQDKAPISNSFRHTDIKRVFQVWLDNAKCVWQYLSSTINKKLLARTHNHKSEIYDDHKPMEGNPRESNSPMELRS